jgi:hypothetical protein
MQQAGFANPEHVGATGFKTSQYTAGALFMAVKIV